MSDDRQAKRETGVILTLWGFGAVMVVGGVALLWGVPGAMLAAGLMLIALGTVMLVIS